MIAFNKYYNQFNILSISLVVISLFFDTYKTVNNLAIKYTVNSVVNIPIPSVNEKPLIGPDPIKNKIIAANKVVIFASSIAVLDFV